MTQDRDDPAKDAANRKKHSVSLALGDRIFEDDDSVIVAFIREIDGKERFTGVFVLRDDHPRFISVRRSNTGEERAYRASL